MHRSDSAFLLLTRIGFAARGIMYLLVGYLALRLGRAEDAGAALAYLRSGAGAAMLAAMALGFGAYGVWRLVDAAFDVEHQGSDSKGIAVRLAHAGSGLIHLWLGFTAVRLALGDDGAEAGTGRTAEDGAATAMSLPGGDLLLLAAAAILLAIAANQLLHAARRRFLRQLAPEARRKAWVIFLGIAGYGARGLLFAMAAWLVYRSAAEHSPAAAGGLADALAGLPSQFRTLAAAGLAMFGAYSLVEARYRIIRNPGIAGRVAQAAGRR